MRMAGWKRGIESRVGYTGSEWRRDWAVPLPGIYTCGSQQGIPWARKGAEPENMNFRYRFMTDSHLNSSAEKKGTRLGLWFPRNDTLPCRDPTAHFAYPVGQSRVLESATRLVVVPLFMAFGWPLSRGVSCFTSGGKFPAPAAIHEARLDYKA